MSLDFKMPVKKFLFAIAIVGSVLNSRSHCADQLASRLLNTKSERPNILVIFTDDQGYGDLSCFGSKEIRTPRIDSLADDGTRFTNFYVQTVCGPSRSALLTGRYPIRSGSWSMPASEITVAELLKKSGYRTCCLGKWDVSNRAAILDRMPNAQGFDYYWGTLGANDNGSVTLHENNTKIEDTSDMASLTRRYTDKAIEFIGQSADRPFFLYLAHTMVHSVIDASPGFRGRSKAGLYGDTVEELDFHTGRLLDALDSLGLRKNTLVIFTTDNGPWNNFQDALSKKHNGQRAWGSSGPLREGKGSTYEGGVRVPCVVRWPEHVPAKRTCDAIFSTIDFLPTFARLASVDVPNDRIIDGVDQTDLLHGKSETGARSDYFYFCKNELHAVRQGNYKLVLPNRKQFYGYVKDKGSLEFELYDLSTDIGERSNLASIRTETVEALKKHAASFVTPDTILEEQIGLKKRSNEPRRKSRIAYVGCSKDEHKRSQRQAVFDTVVDFSNRNRELQRTGFNSTRLNERLPSICPRRPRRLLFLQRIERGNRSPRPCRLWIGRSHGVGFDHCAWRYGRRNWGIQPWWSDRDLWERWSENGWWDVRWRHGCQRFDRLSRCVCDDRWHVACFRKGGGDARTTHDGWNDLHSRRGRIDGAAYRSDAFARIRSIANRIAFA